MKGIVLRKEASPFLTPVVCASSVPSDLSKYKIGTLLLDAPYILSVTLIGSAPVNPVKGDIWLEKGSPAGMAGRNYFLESKNLRFYTGIRSARWFDGDDWVKINGWYVQYTNNTTNKWCYQFSKVE